MRTRNGLPRHLHREGDVSTAMLAITFGFGFHGFAGATLLHCKDSTPFQPNRPSQNKFRKRVPLRPALRDAASWPCGIRNADFVRGERDRPGCRFRRRAENPSPKLNGLSKGSGATPEPARETRALPPIVHPKMNSGKEFPSVAFAGAPLSPSLVPGGTTGN